MEQNDIFLKGQIAEEFDFYRIRDEIASLCVSEDGRDEILSRESTGDEDAIRKLKDLGREWSLVVNSTRPRILSAWPPVKKSFSVLGVEGSSLNHEEIFGLGLFAEYCERAKDGIESASLEFSILNLMKMKSSMPSLAQARNEVFSVLDISTGEVRDLPVLREIRSRISSLKKEIENALRKYSADNTLNQALQSKVPVFRADRELLAVRADHRNSVSGIVHEVSSTGQTLYIEPDEIVRANNQLVQEEFALHAEINRIFRDLTAVLSAYKEDFESCHSAMVMFDATYAAAVWQRDMHGVFAEECTGSEPPLLLEARHPLLGEKAVPVTVRFMEGKNVLVVTGPNTGGKTVTLKTIALFSLLNQAGFPVPAAEGTRLPVFRSIFADIGDEQSIENSLSTFSSRMKKIALAVANADEHSLVVLDELGSGTDPLEGSAIAMAVLDDLLEKNAFVLVTTHHGVLKNYGWANPKCVNASVEFDSGTLSATYRLLMGVPGESHAIDIARHSGLPHEILENAKNYISTEQADVSSLIKGLVEKHAEADSLLKEIREKEREISRKELKIHERENRILEREVAVKEKEHAESSDFVRKTRSELENLVRVLREGEINREKTLGVRKFLDGISDDVEKQNGEIDSMKEEFEKDREKIREEQERIAENGMRISSRENQSKSSKKTKKRLKNSDAIKNVQPVVLEVPVAKKKPVMRVEDLYSVGAEVLCGSERRRGTLVRKVKDGLWQVSFGSLKMNVSQKQMYPLGKSEASFMDSVQKSAVIISDGPSSSDEKPKFELKLLGMRYEEAMNALEHQLDLCAIHNFRNFSVVHGKGNGVLQQAVHDYLSHYPGVKDFHFARPEEGGSGKTYVELI